MDVETRSGVHLAGLNGQQRRPRKIEHGMKAYRYHRYGTPDVLRLEDVEVPLPSDDEVLVRIRAVSLN
jgi:hypothetical protein